MIQYMYISIMCILPFTYKAMYNKWIQRSKAVTDVSTNNITSKVTTAWSYWRIGILYCQFYVIISKCLFGYPVLEKSYR